MKKVLSLLLAVVMVIGMLPLGLISASAADVTTLATFNLGANGSAGHNDGSSATTYTEDNNGYTLSITGGVKMSTGARDEKGNSCLKFGTSSVVGSCSFTVPDDVTEVIIYAAKYKAKTSKIDVNGSAYTLTNSSNDGAYDEITVDTSTTKTVSFTTVSGGVRAMVNTIVFNGAAGSEDCAHTNTTEIAEVPATCTTNGTAAGVKCADCNMPISGFETIEALGHSYGEFVVTTPASCTTAGEQTKTCANGCGVDITEEIAALGHSYGEDGICTVCQANQANVVSYELVNLGDNPITAGNYIIAGQRGAASYPTVYPATATLSGDWTVTTSVDANAGVITSDMIATDAQVFVLEGNASEGFTIGYNNGTEMVYLGVSDYSENRKMAFGAEYNTIRWTMTAADKGGYALTHPFTTSDGAEATYAVSDNSTRTDSIRGYKSGATYYGIYLFKEVIEDAPVCNHETTTVVGKVDATCTEAGYTGDTICANEACGIKLEDGAAIEALGHNYVDGVCTNCNEAEPDLSDVTSYELVTADTVRAGNYIIGAIRSGSYPAVYPATGAISSGDIVVAGTSIEATDDKLTSDMLEGAQVIVLTGDNTNGFTIGYNNGTEMVYLGYTSVANRKLAFSADYSNTYWKISTFNNGVKLSDGKINIFQNSTGTGAIRGYTTTYSDGKGIYLFREVVANECVHTVETWTIETAATCTTSGLQTGACALCGETQTSVIPATGHTFAYSETAIICANCTEYSQPYTLNTIAEAKAYTDANTVYYVKGIVTYIKGTTVYIEDATGAMCVYFTSGTTLDFVVGDEILVWDTMTTYNGLIETTYTTASEYVKVSSGNALPMQTVTLADLLADETNEYLGERVVIEGLTMGTINETGTTPLTDASGNTINIYAVSGMTENVNANDIVTVTAIVSTRNGYQLLINPDTAATDVVVTEERPEVIVETVTIAEAKAGTAGEYYQVEGVVTFIDGRNVYIQDATGGIVVYLTANAATTAIGDKVKAYGALKVYNGLIELDGIDQTNTEFFEVLSNGNTVDAQAVTMGALAGDTTNEYLAEKVTLENIYISTVGSWSSQYKNVDYTLSDGTNTIKIFRAPAATEADVLAAGTIVNVEAIVSSYNGYQLRVVDATKITATGACPAEIVTAAGTVTKFMDLQEAVTTTGADADNIYLRLLADAENVNLELDDFIYIDLNGHKLTGSLVTDGVSVYGMDSATDGYSCEDMGVFNCVDENGEAIVPVAQFKAAVNGNKRYLAIADENGYTFHRFYLGITHATVKPGTKGVGYKAVFAGDEMVQACIDSFGFNLQLGNNTPVTVSKEGSELVNKDTWTLRIDNYDAKNMGLTELSASVFMVINGETVSTATYTTTLKDLVEAINDITDLAETKKAALAAWIAESETMKSWNVGNIYTEAEPTPEA